MKALILAAGYATRLYPLTEKQPKPLLPVAGKPIMEYILEKIDSLPDVSEILVVTNQKFFEQFQEWRKGYASTKSITILNDKTTSNEDRLGAIGDMNFVIEEAGIDEDLLVVAGDNIFKLNLNNFLSFARGKGGLACVGIYDIRNKNLATKYGIVLLDAENRVVEFEEKPEAPRTSLVATGLYYFPREALGLMSEYLKSGLKQDAPGHYIDWLHKKGDVYGFIFTQSWLDIGDLASYQKADRKFRER